MLIRNVFHRRRVWCHLCVNRNWYFHKTSVFNVKLWKHSKNNSQLDFIISNNPCIFGIVKIIKSSILIVSVLFLLVGSIGVDVFSHFCEDDEVSVSYFVADEDHCEDHEHEIKHLSSCCDITDAEVCDKSDDDHGCRDDEVKHIQLKLDYLHKYAVQAVIIPELDTELFAVLEDIPVDALLPDYNNNSPPCESGRDIILKKQYWLI